MWYMMSCLVLATTGIGRRWSRPEAWFVAESVGTYCTPMLLPACHAAAFTLGPAAPTTPYGPCCDVH